MFNNQTPMINNKKTKKGKDKREVAIKVENLSKDFRVPHEKNKSLKSTTLNVFKKKNYTDFHALKDVSFEVKKGEFFGIIGSNGSGKSTLLKILAGIYVPDKGNVIIDGKLSPFLELGVGFNPELTGRENLFLGGAIMGLSREEVAEKFDKIVDFAELREFIDMKLQNYSSGMQVRLAFALAINVHAEILLMDEVLAVGDSNFQSKCLGEFNKYKKQGKAVVLVTHDISVIQQHCNVAMLLKEGKVVKIGHPNEVSDIYLLQNIEAQAENIPEGIEIGEGKKKSRVANIKKIEILDKDNKGRSTFKPGEDILVKVYFDINKKMDIFNFCFGLYNGWDHYTYGLSSILDRLDTKKYLEQGFFQIKLKNNILLSNSYYVRISIVGDDPLTLYDYALSESFRIISKEKNEGVFEMEYEWL